MKRIWFLSDTHFGHANIIEYCQRPFSSVQEMDEAIVDRWNAVVRPEDHVYHMGDVALKVKDLATVNRLNGHKRLIRGNHDIYDTRDYIDAGFKEIHGCRVLGNVLFTHFPIHPDSLGRYLGNAHGHIHERPSPPGAYVNLSVERTGYAPVLLDAVVEALRAQEATLLELGRPSRGSEAGPQAARSTT